MELLEKDRVFCHLFLFIIFLLRGRVVPLKFHSSRQEHL